MNTESNNITSKDQDSIEQSLISLGLEENLITNVESVLAEIALLEKSKQLSAHEELDLLKKAEALKNLLTVFHKSSSLVLDTKDIMSERLLNQSQGLYKSPHISEESEEHIVRFMNSDYPEDTIATLLQHKEYKRLQIQFHKIIGEMRPGKTDEYFLTTEFGRAAEKLLNDSEEGAIAHIDLLRKFAEKMHTPEEILPAPLRNYYLNTLSQKNKNEQLLAFAQQNDPSATTEHAQLQIGQTYLEEIMLGENPDYKEAMEIYMLYLKKLSVDSSLSHEKQQTLLGSLVLLTMLQQGELEKFTFCLPKETPEYWDQKHFFTDVEFNHEYFFPDFKVRISPEIIAQIAKTPTDLTSLNFQDSFLTTSEENKDRFNQLWKKYFLKECSHIPLLFSLEIRYFEDNKMFPHISTPYRGEKGTYHMYYIDEKKTCTETVTAIQREEGRMQAIIEYFGTSVLSSNERANIITRYLKNSDQDQNIPLQYKIDGIKKALEIISNYFDTWKYILHGNYGYKGIVDLSNALERYEDTLSKLKREKEASQGFFHKLLRKTSLKQKNLEKQISEFHIEEQQQWVHEQIILHTHLPLFENIRIFFEKEKLISNKRIDPIILSIRLLEYEFVKQLSEKVDADIDVLWKKRTFFNNQLSKLTDSTKNIQWDRFSELFEEHTLNAD